METATLKYLLYIGVMLKSLSGFSQQPLQVMNWKTDVTINTYLSETMHRQYESRRQLLKTALTDRSRTQAYVDRIKAKANQLIPNRQKRIAEADATGIWTRQAYTIQTLTIDGFIGPITANLYAPEGSGKFPAILFLCGHEDIAKATPSYQQTAASLATNGFIVLVVDPVSQAERHQLLDSLGKPRTRGGTTEHTLINQAAALFGESLAAYQVWDNQYALDILLQMRAVDTTRVGVTGNSGGAIQSIYLASVDPRIKVISVSSYFSSRERTFDLSGAADGCAHIPGEGKSLMEMNDFLLAAAPRPIQITAGRYDFIDYKGALVAFGEMQDVYKKLNACNRLDLFTWDDGHGLSLPKRNATVGWFRKWLSPGKIIISKDSLSDVAALRVTKSGQVLRDSPASGGIFQYLKDKFDSTSRERTAFSKKIKSDQQHEIRKLLQLPVLEKITADTVGEINLKGISFRKIILRTPGQPPIPLLVTGDPKSSKETVLVVGERQMSRLADSSSFVQTLLSNGAHIVLADLSGFGETADKPALNDPKFFNREYRNAMLALHTGISMPGQRTSDVLRIVEYLFNKKRPLKVMADGAATVPALHAAALDQRIRHLQMQNGIRSFKQVFEFPMQHNWYSVIIPGILKYYDLPDLVRLAGIDRISFSTTGDH